MTREKNYPTKEKSIFFAVLVADGHLRAIPDNLKTSHKIEILTTPLVEIAM